MFDHLVDRWGRDQCPGGASGRNDPGFTADVVHEPVRQRLDYLFTSSASELAVTIHGSLTIGVDGHGTLPGSRQTSRLLKKSCVRP